MQLATLIVGAAGTATTTAIAAAVTPRPIDLRARTATPSSSIADLECFDDPQSAIAHWPAIASTALCIGATALIAGSYNFGEARTTLLVSACGGIGLIVDVIATTPPAPKIRTKAWKMGRRSPPSTEK